MDTRHEIIFVKEASTYAQAELNQALVDLCLATKQLINKCETQIKALTNDPIKAFLQTMLEKIKTQSSCVTAFKCSDKKKCQKSEVLTALNVQNAELKKIQDTYTTFKNDLMNSTEPLVTIQLFLELDAAQKQHKKNILVYTYQGQFEKIKGQLATMGFVEEQKSSSPQPEGQETTSNMPPLEEGSRNTSGLKKIIKDCARQWEENLSRFRSRAEIKTQTQKAIAHAINTQICVCAPQTITTTSLPNPNPTAMASSAPINSSNDKKQDFEHSSMPPSFFRKLLRPAIIIGTLTALAVCAYKFGPSLWHWYKRSLS